MNVRWIKWSDLLAEAGILRNLDSGLHQIEAPEARRIAQAVNVATDYAWKFHPWECACWVMNAGVGSIDKPEPYMESSFAVLQAYAEDPLEAWDAGREPKLRAFDIRQGTLRLAPLAEDAARFLLLRTAPPRFGGDERDDTRAYQKSDLIYDSSTGECWRCQLAHTGTAPATEWVEWADGDSYTQAGSQRVRHNGWLYDCTDDHDADSTNEPLYGAGWPSVWGTSEKWTPQRLPDFLLTAVLAGARSWMDSPDTAAMHAAMLGALEDEVRDFSFSRRQRSRTGATTTVL